MRVNYKGMDKNFDYRVAEINFDGDTELTLMERIAFFLNRVKGYSVDIITDGYALVEVDNMREYKEFVMDYKEAKKMIKDCMKFGF